MCFRANCHPAQLSRLHKQVGGKPTQDGFISKCSFPFKNIRYTQTFLNPLSVYKPTLMSSKTCWTKTRKTSFSQKQPIWPTHRGLHPPIFHGHFGMPWHPSQRPRSWPRPPAFFASMAPYRRCWGCGRRERWGRTPFRRFKFWWRKCGSGKSQPFFMMVNFYISWEVGYYPGLLWKNVREIWEIWANEGNIWKHYWV